MIEGEKETLKAAVITGSAQKFAKRTAKVGMKYLDLGEAVEKFIRDEGGTPAWPVNLSVNEVAAHDVAMIGDDRVIPENALLKIDIGVHIDGYICDTAQTIDFSGEWGKLSEASKMALENAASVMEPGVDVSDIGAEIEATIKEYGFKPIQNLGGHSMDRWTVHSGLSIPNIDSKAGSHIPEFSVIAIEPFASTGSGWVSEGASPGIFRVERDVPIRNKDAKKILKRAAERNGLPFSPRWYAGDISSFKMGTAFRELTQKHALHSYPPLKDIKGSMVSQWETSFLIYEDDIKILVEL